MFDVTGIGALSMDYICMLDDFPAEDCKEEIDDIEIQGGGNIATALVAVARLGGKPCYHGFVGDDSTGYRIIEEFKDEGIDTGYLSIKEGRNPVSIVIISRKKNTRTILYTKKMIPIFGKGDINTELIKSSAVLLVDFYHERASLEAAKKARANYIPVVVDAERSRTLSMEIINNSTHVITSKDFAFEVTGITDEFDMVKILKRLSNHVKASFVCITFGSKGVIGFDRKSKEIIFQKAFKVNTVDTTGAGDVFHGAFSFFLSKGYSLKDNLKYSSACAALKCRSIGGRKGIPTMKELVEFLKR